MKIENKLAQMREGIKKAPTEIQQTVNHAAKLLKQSDLVKNAIQLGDTIDNHMLLNTENQPVSLNELKGKKNLLITFYRGGW